MTRIGIYPGSFDPLTFGHMDVIERGARLVDRLVIALGINAAKNAMFTVEERLATIARETAHLDNVSAVSFDGLLMDFAESQGAAIIIRGVRGVTDFEYEYQLTGMNRALNDRIETVFLMADVALQPIASRLVKEIAAFGGPIGKFVPPDVEAEVLGKIAARAG